MSIIHTTLLIFCLIMTSACASTRMQSPKQHRHMEVSGGLAATPLGDGPDILVDGMVTLGLFDITDISAHLGKTRSALYGGMGARVYPTQWLTLSGQFEYRDGNDFDTTNHTSTYRGVLRTSLVLYNNKYGGFYIGPQMTWHNHDVHTRGGLLKNDLELLTAGSFLGAEYKLGPWGAVQFEFSISPVFINYNSATPGTEGFLEAKAYYGAHLGQASVGYTIFFEDLFLAVKAARAKF